MYYELYVDVLFLTNFMMDYILLLLVKQMLKCTATHGRICFGAALGAVLTCIIVIVPIPYSSIKQILFHILVNTCMIYGGLRIKTIRSYLKAIIMLYIGSFLLGGIMEAFWQYTRVGSLFLVIAIGGYYLTLGIWKFISYVQRWNQSHCEVELYNGNIIYKTKGIIDTGNSLRDPINGKPVSILNRAVIKQLIEKELEANIRYIPYQSISKNVGVLAVFQIDKMCIRQKEECWVEKPLIAISEEEISVGGECELILNPNLF